MCQQHAREDMRAANELCRRKFEALRQSAGRKTLPMIQREFDAWVLEVDARRIEDSRVASLAQIRRLCGLKRKAGMSGKKTKNERHNEGDWRYQLRPCTMRGCEREYCPFDGRFYLWYRQKFGFGFRALDTLCPDCAEEDVVAMERQALRKRRHVSNEKWEEWLQRVQKEREVEKAFWEQVQERRFREKAEGPKAQKDSNVEGGVGTKWEGPKGFRRFLGPWSYSWKQGDDMSPHTI